MMSFMGKRRRTNEGWVFRISYSVFRYATRNTMYNVTRLDTVLRESTQAINAQVRKGAYDQC